MLTDLRLALRSLARTPTFAVAAVLTLALGIGTNTATFSVVYGVPLKPLPFSAPDCRSRSHAARRVVAELAPMPKWSTTCVVCPRAEL
jgi:hypothetical protein